VTSGAILENLVAPNSLPVDAVFELIERAFGLALEES
jgi:hypothetical protein